MSLDHEQRVIAHRCHSNGAVLRAVRRLAGVESSLPVGLVADTQSVTDAALSVPAHRGGSKMGGQSAVSI